MKPAFITTMESAALHLLDHTNTKKKTADTLRAVASWAPGNSVRIRKSRRSPQPGDIGKIVSVDPADAYGTYLVKFGNGLQFRYQESEFISLTGAMPNRQIRK